MTQVADGSCSDSLINYREFVNKLFIQSLNVPESETEDPKLRLAQFNQLKKYIDDGMQTILSTIKGIKLKI